MTRMALALVVIAACGRDAGDPGAGSAVPSRPPDPADRCDDFVAFAWKCDIGRPPRDPTLDLATQGNNDLIIMMGVIDQCRAHRPPFDPGLLTCFASAAGDCERYKACADGVVAARRAAQGGSNP